MLTRSDCADIVAGQKRRPRCSTDAVASLSWRGGTRLVAAGGEVQPRPDLTSDAGIEALPDGLAGEARHGRAELIAWLLDRASQWTK